METSDYKNILVEIADLIATITINRPEALNALNRETLKELNSAFDCIKLDTNIRAVIITGAGEKAFVAGADIAELQKLTPTGGDNYSGSYSRTGQEIFQYIWEFPKPVIAAVNGYALGGGCELAMACHLRYASEKAMFGQPEINLGIISGFHGTLRLPRLVGQTKALEMLLFGQPISAQMAFDLSLINGVFNKDIFMEKVMEIAKQIAQQAPIAVQYILNAVRAGLEISYSSRDAESALFAKVLDTPDAQEGLAAFLEKRKPNFTGKNING